MATRIAYQGVPGAHSEAAVRSYGGGAEGVACATFEDVFRAVQSGEAAYGMVPIENSLGGSVDDTSDLLSRYQLPIVGEVALRVRHCLLAKPGTRLEDVQRAYSHPQALAQSQLFLASHDITPCAASNTAAAAKALAERDEPGAAAIAGHRAAELYGLAILAEDIQTRQDNTTRFWLIARERPVGLIAEKASLVFAAANAPGSLYACLGSFARRGLNLTRLDARPLGEPAWDYLFHLDFEANAGALAPVELDALLAELEAQTSFLRLLGHYPKSAIALNAQPQADPAPIAQAEG